MSSRNGRIWPSVMLTAVVVATTFRPGGAGQARTPVASRPEFLAYGVAGITVGQTARLHAVSFGNPDDQPVELTFYNSQGTVLSRSSVILSPGRSTFLDLRILDPPLGAGPRLEFYAVMRYRELKQGYVIPTLEVIDSETGRTISFISDPLG